MKPPSGLFFRDDSRRIDFVLVYHSNSPHSERRDVFERNLRAEGLMMEKEEPLYTVLEPGCQTRRRKGNYRFDKNSNEKLTVMLMITIIVVFLFRL